MLKAVIFDLDGVLIDSEPLMRFAFEASYKEVLSHGSPPTEAFLERMGMAFPDILEQLGLPQTLWQPYREKCQQHLDRITLFPGSREVLTWLRGQGLTLSILTGKDQDRTLQILKHFDLSPFFAIVVTSDQLEHPKPHPEGILRTLQVIGCTVTEAVMIGDAVNDIVAAQRAGVTAIAVTWGIKPERVQTLCQPDYIVHDWDALYQLVLRQQLSPEACPPRSRHSGTQAGPVPL